MYCWYSASVWKGHNHGYPTGDPLKLKCYQLVNLDVSHNHGYPTGDPLNLGQLAFVADVPLPITTVIRPWASAISELSAAILFWRRSNLARVASENKQCCKVLNDKYLWKWLDNAWRRRDPHPRQLTFGVARVVFHLAALEAEAPVLGHGRRQKPGRNE
jgi:hypothetical protein